MHKNKTKKKKSYLGQCPSDYWFSRSVSFGFVHLLHEGSYYTHAISLFFYLSVSVNSR